MFDQIAPLILHMLRLRYLLSLGFRQKKLFDQHLQFEVEVPTHSLLPRYLHQLPGLASAFAIMEFILFHWIV